MVSKLYKMGPQNFCKDFIMPAFLTSRVCEKQVSLVFLFLESTDLRFLSINNFIKILQIQEIEQSISDILKIITSSV
jgi:hypothetical protein